MLTITVNGRVQKLSIGCRTFISLDVLLKMLEAAVQVVTLNGETVHWQNFASTEVHSGNELVFE
jgi:hypothetical protein